MESEENVALQKHALKSQSGEESFHKGTATKQMNRV
jgi:hypothetical protein